MVNTNLIAIYIRVSSEEQVKGYSIDGQLEELRAYAAEHQLSIYREYVDDGYSGKSIDGRPAMLELLADAKQSRFHTVITWKLSRLARNLVDQLKMLKLFKQHNISYISLNRPYSVHRPRKVYWSFQRPFEAGCTRLTRANYQHGAMERGSSDSE
ncbi:recombinase family protein [Paenibacillus sp. J2TS4]|uniref:recombinase family protein n=1 Tax=Paenibacillus sp. J2TS4 TaxID=2807194 RepID=UPI001BCD221D|nr:recombinase family protein [Paenibacillus sp. J2TS4]